MAGKYAAGSVMRSGAGPIVLKASAAETTSTTGPAVAVEGSTLYVKVDVTGGSGTPTMTVVIEGSPDGGTTWVGLGTVGLNGYMAGSIGTAPSNFTGAAATHAVLPAMPLVRYRSVIGGGTPSLTYSVTADAL
jgi:hypothetical protein